MNARERLTTAIAGGVPDRIPVSLWFHFGSEHLPPAEVARLHAVYQREYRWDFLKVMADYRAVLPAALDRDHALDRDGPPGPDLDALAGASDWEAPFARQRECLRLLRDDLGEAVPLLDTVYSPWMFLLRHVGRDRREALLAEPRKAAAILEHLTQATCRHVDALAELGLFGVYVATTAACLPADSAEFALQSAGDLAVLRRAKGLARFLHLHGSGVNLDRVASYPREVLHCADRDPSNPGLAALRAVRGAGGDAAGDAAHAGAIMGGICERTITQVSLPVLRGQIDDAIASAGPAGFILAAGCTVPPSVAGRTLHDIRRSPLLDTARAVRAMRGARG